MSVPSPCRGRLHTISGILWNAPREETTMAKEVKHGTAIFAVFGAALVAFGLYYNRVGLFDTLPPPKGAAAVGRCGEGAKFTAAASNIYPGVELYYLAGGEPVLTGTILQTGNAEIDGERVSALLTDDARRGQSARDQGDRGAFRRAIRLRL